MQIRSLALLTRQGFKEEFPTLNDTNGIFSSSALLSDTVVPPIHCFSSTKEKAQSILLQKIYVRFLSLKSFAMAVKFTLESSLGQYKISDLSWQGQKGRPFPKEVCQYGVAQYHLKLAKGDPSQWLTLVTTTKLKEKKTDTQSMMLEKQVCDSLRKAKEITLWNKLYIQTSLSTWQWYRIAEA